QTIVQPPPVAGRTWPRVIPWFISTAACVLLGLFWQDSRARQDELEAALARLEERGATAAANPPRRPDDPEQHAGAREAFKQALREAFPHGVAAPPDARLDRVQEGLTDLNKQLAGLSKSIANLPRPVVAPDPQVTEVRHDLVKLRKQVSDLAGLIEKLPRSAAPADSQ